jgi:hypothetical protein
MPYIPFTPAPPVIVEAGAVQGYTNGFFYSPSYNLELNKIAFEINALQFQFSSLAAQGEVGSPAMSMATASANLGLLVKSVNVSNGLLETLTASVGLVANKLDVVASGLGTISSHASSVAVTQKMAFADQAKNNKHSQLTTEAAQVAAGLPKTVVTPQINFDTIKENLQDYAMVDGQVVAIGVLNEAATKAFGAGQTAVVGWVAE